jgi:uncharacterized protein with FMN-binding domain
MSKKMPRSLVALSASAIAAVYLTGFAVTRSADATVAGSAAPTVASTSVTGTANSSAPAVTAYRDGTYSATGTSRRGNVSVSLTVAGGRITNVSIASVTTEYPASRISSLPAQVVATQSSQVNSISGATYSADAFRQAVQLALQKASAS